MDRGPTLACLLLAFALPAIARESTTAETPGPPPPPAADARDLPAPGVEEGGGILFGRHFAFSVKAPRGWLFDNHSGVPQGLHAVLYRKGETYETSEGMMYARGFDPEPGRPGTLDQFIVDDLADFREDSPAVQTFDAGPFVLADGTPVRVVGYRGDRWGNVEAVAYVEHGGAFYMLVLTARSQRRFDADLPAFRDFVRGLVPMERGDDSTG